MSFARLLVALPVMLVVACSAAPDERSSSSDDALKAVGTGGLDGLGSVSTTPPPPPPPLAFPPIGASYCMSVDPACTIEYATPDQEQPYQCSLPFTYGSGQVEGLVRGILTLCPDNAEVRQAYASKIITGLCDRCLPTAPSGTVYVGLDVTYYQVKPNCQTGCPIGGGNPVIGIGGGSVLGNAGANK